MTSSNPPSASASAEKMSIPAACNRNPESPPSDSEGIQASPTQGHARMSNNSTLGLILFLQIFFISLRCFPFNIDFQQHSILIRILNPRWHAGLFSVPLIFCLWRLVDGCRPETIRANVVRNWVERDTNVNLIRMMGFLAASTLTGDVVELSAVSVEEFAADMSFERFGTMGLGGIVLFSMAALFMLTMLLVSLVWRLVWVPVLIIADGLPQVEVQKRHYRRCADEAKGHSSTVNREGLAHSNRKTALDVHGSNRRVDILLSHLKENLSFGFGIARKIGFWLFLNDLWEAAMFPILFLQFFCNRRSGRIDAVLSGDGSSHDPGDRAEVDKHAEAQSQQMKDSDAPNFRQPKSERNCSGEWVVVEEYAGRGEHRER